MMNNSRYRRMKTSLNYSIWPATLWLARGRCQEVVNTPPGVGLSAQRGKALSLSWGDRALKNHLLFLACQLPESPNIGYSYFPESSDSPVIFPVKTITPSMSPKVILLPEIDPFRGILVFSNMSGSARVPVSVGPFWIMFAMKVPSASAVVSLGGCPRIGWLAHFLEKNFEIILKDTRL